MSIASLVFAIVPGFVWNMIESITMNVLAPIFMPIVEANLMPDWIIRVAVRAFLGQKLVIEDRGNEASNMAAKMEYIRKLRDSPIAIEQKKANQQHYEVPTEFYDLCLGARKKYSCCQFVDSNTTLEESEDLSLSLVCERARLHLLSKSRGDEPRPAVLDFGCGWGSFTLYAAERFPHVDFTAVSNSASQREYITELAGRRKLSNVKVITADASVFSPPDGATYDRVVSIEMMEHLKNYEALFSRIKTWLRRGGYMFVHIFTHRRFAYHFEDGWMAEQFFSGGQMPSDDLFCYFQRDLCLRDHWIINGIHYQRTLDAWLARLDANKSKVLELFSKADNPTLELVKWRLFFIVCSESFGYRGGEEWQVSHYLFQRPDDVEVPSLPTPHHATSTGSASAAAVAGSTASSSLPRREKTL